MENRQLVPHMSLVDTGELKIQSDILRNLTAQLCKLTKCANIGEAWYRIRRESRTRIKTHPTYYSEVFSAPKSVVKQWTRSMGLVSVPGLYSDLDLDKGKYEGGFKVWESTNDLIKFITQDESIMNNLTQSNATQFRVLELGAGASLPSLALLSRLIGDQNFHSEYRIHVQDYNWQVLASLTLINFSLNLPLDYLKALLDTKCLRFFYGDWKDFRSQSNYKYNLIMMSEVIYNSDNYDALHNLIERHLKPVGYVLIATKDTYFGLSGGIYSWLDFVHAKGIFRTFRTRISTNNIPRSILVMKRV